MYILSLTYDLDAEEHLKDLQVSILKADFLLIFYDINNKESKLNIKNKWIPLIQQLCEKNKKEMVFVLLSKPNYYYTIILYYYIILLYHTIILYYTIMLLC
jgi:GTPase SAR1 family protein